MATSLQRQKSIQRVVFFDGVCNLCNQSVQFLIRQDKNNALMFASLQSDYAASVLTPYPIDHSSMKSFILLDDNKVYTKSSAALKVTSYLGKKWTLMQVFWVIPKFARDTVYDIVAKNRYKWFGKKDACMIPSSDLKVKFLG